MARRPFGGGTSDFVARAAGGALLVVSGQVTFWSAATGGTQYTDLLNTVGAAATSITTDSSGQIPAFQGPNTGVAVMWADAGGASRQVMYATDVPTRLSSLETSSATTTALSSETSRATAAEGLAAQKSANLSDLASAAAARTSLGLGTAATQASSVFEPAGLSSGTNATLNATFALGLPVVGGYTYDSNGNVLTDPEGHTYTYNGDGTIHTETFAGVTRTYGWTAGVLTGVS